MTEPKEPPTAQTDDRLKSVLSYLLPQKMAEEILTFDDASLADLLMEYLRCDSEAREDIRDLFDSGTMDALSDAVKETIESQGDEQDHYDAAFEVHFRGRVELKRPDKATDEDLEKAALTVVHAIVLNKIDNEMLEHIPEYMMGEGLEDFIPNHKVPFAIHNVTSFTKMD